MMEKHWYQIVQEMRDQGHINQWQKCKIDIKTIMKV